MKETPRVSRVVTKTGDGGKTSLTTGERVCKRHHVVKAIGEVDELNCWIGTIYGDISRPGVGGIPGCAELNRIQHILFDIGGVLSGGEMSPRISEATEELTQSIADMNQTLSPLREFVLPGGNIHIARAICRRVERSILDLKYNRTVPPKFGEMFKQKRLPVIGAFLNRLSDWLFVFARTQGIGPEPVWEHM